MVTSLLYYNYNNYNRVNASAGKNAKDIVFPGSWGWCTVLQNQLFCKHRTNTASSSKDKL